MNSHQRLLSGGFNSYFLQKVGFHFGLDISENEKNERETETEMMNALVLRMLRSFEGKKSFISKIDCTFKLVECDPVVLKMYLQLINQSMRPVMEAVHTQ